ncbi:MAG: multiheme c-type cytochrome [Planctomycetota bacterium]|nr:multiheme c-type cytochrome [Planctomycetota bacterium]MDA1165129.1 multiheme c-type cytochrome [Planctomycetota bacterium]
MPTSFRLIKRVIQVSAVGLAAFVVFQTAGPEAPVTESAVVAQDSLDSAKPQFQGIRSCVPCHNESIGENNPFITMSREFCVLNEVSIFTGDKHRQAYELLKGELGLRMEKILAHSRSEPGYKVTDDKQCLACHANFHWKEGFERPPLFEFGVTCESCHGPSSLWEGPHDDPLWRKVSAEEKEQKYGMIDVRNPVRRARQCFSCHVGNVQEGKVVTHEMYAAGHPPLPGIEIETFSEQMPTHWRTLNEKGEFQFREDYIKANFPGLEHQPLDDLARTKSVIIGGTMALRETVNLFASQAVDDDSQAWPELAVFDCSACHHELAAPSWRQKRGYGKSLPGRPQMFAWPEALVKLGIRQRAGDNDEIFQKDWDAYHGRMEELRRVLDRRPFGDPKAIQAVAMGEAGLVAWLDQLANDVFRSSVGKDDAQRTLQTLVSLPPDSYPDFHSARQLVWAIRTILSEMNSDIPAFAAAVEGETEKQSIDRALANLKVYNDWKSGDRASARQKANELLSMLELTEKLRLDLPAGDKYVIAEQLPESLKAIGGYDPEWFREQLQELAKNLRPQSN